MAINNILSNKNIYLLEGSGTPLSEGATGPTGSLYVDKSSGKIYTVTVAGSSAGWSEIGAAQDLQTVLAAGNTTSGNNIQVTNNDYLEIGSTGPTWQFKKNSSTGYLEVYNSEEGFVTQIFDQEFFHSQGISGSEWTFQSNAGYTGGYRSRWSGPNLAGDNYINIGSAGPTFAGLVYGNDLTSNFIANSLITKQYVDSQVAGLTATYLPLAGGTMTGNIEVGDGFELYESTANLGITIADSAAVEPDYLSIGSRDLSKHYIRMFTGPKGQQELQLRNYDGFDSNRYVSLNLIDAGFNLSSVNDNNGNNGTLNISDDGTLQHVATGSSASATFRISDSDATIKKFRNQTIGYNNIIINSDEISIQDTSVPTSSSSWNGTTVTMNIGSSTNRNYIAFIDFTNQDYYRGGTVQNIKFSPRGATSANVIMSPRANWQRGVLNSVAIGGTGLYIKTDNTVYVPQLSIQSTPGSTYDGILNSQTLSADRTWTLPNAGGTVALTSDLSTYVNGATNGLTLSGQDIKLGGTLIENTTIDGSFDFTIRSHNNQVFLNTGNVKGELAWAIGSTNGFINANNPDPVYNQAFFGSLSARELITIQAGASGHGTNESTSMEINYAGISYFQNDGSGNINIGNFDRTGFRFVGGTTGPYRSATLRTQLLTTDREYEMPDANGTIALQSDLSGYADGATNGLSLANGTTGAVKLGGTLIENTTIDGSFDFTIRGYNNEIVLASRDSKSLGGWAIGSTNAVISPVNGDVATTQSTFGSISSKEFITVQVGASGWSPQSSTWEFAQGGYAQYWHDHAGGVQGYPIFQVDKDGVSIKSGGSTAGSAILKSDNILGNREFQFPDVGGTVALLSDIDGVDVYGATNGLSLSNGTTGDVKLGGTLIENTTINTNTYDFTLQDTGFANGAKIHYSNLKSLGYLAIGTTSIDLSTSVNATSIIGIHGGQINMLSGDYTNGSTYDLSSAKFTITSRTAGNVDGIFDWYKTEGLKILGKGSRSIITINVDRDAFINTVGSAGTNEKTNAVFEGNASYDTNGATGFGNEAQIRQRHLLYNTSVGFAGVYLMPDGSSLFRRPFVGLESSKLYSFHTITGTIMAMDDSYNMKSWSVKTLLKNVSGATAQVSSTIETLGGDSALDDATISVNFAADNNTRLGVYCTGVTGATVNWSSDLQIHTVSQA